jgi:hypothetical protein
LAVPNPFADGDSFNLTEQGQLVRENPQRAAEMIAAAGKQKEYSFTLGTIEADRAAAITQSISTEAVAGEHDAVRLAKLNHQAEHDHVRYSVDGSEAEHRELAEKVAQMTPEQRMVDVETTFKMLTYGESGPYIRAMSAEQKTSAHKIVSDFVNNIGSDAGQFQADVSRLPAAVIGAFMSELGSGKHTDDRSLFVGVSKALSQGKNATRRGRRRHARDRPLAQGNAGHSPERRRAPADDRNSPRTNRQWLTKSQNADRIIERQNDLRLS